MKELRRKQQIKNALYSYPSLALLAVITFFLIKGAMGIMNIERESAGRVQELEKEAQALRQREQELEVEIGRLQTEEGIVEEIREKFSVTREGEHVAIIVEPKEVASSTEETGAQWLKGLWNKLQSLWR